MAERFTDHGDDLKGNNDLLTLTKPELVARIHDDFLEVGCDLVETNTFNANRISQADYALEDLSEEINREAARLARQACDEWGEKSGQRRFVVGVIGPTNRTASISPNVTSPGYRNIDFATLVQAYTESPAACSTAAAT